MPVTPDDLTPGQARVLKWLISQETYVAPVTVRQTGAALGIRNPNGVMNHFRALEEKGWIKRGPGARQVRILKHPEAEP